MLEKFNLHGDFYYLGNYTKNNYIYTTAMIHLIGKLEDIKKYIKYLDGNKKILNVEMYESIVFVLAKHKADLKLYEAGYSQQFIHPAPAYLSEEGFEIIEVASWDKKPLMDYIKIHKENKTTTYFEIIKFIEKKMDDIYVSRLLPKLSEKQREAVNLAYKKGYYEYPKKIDLGELAKLMSVSKSTFQEHLKRAEGKLIPRML